jgi:hypothetical protein
MSYTLRLMRVMTRMMMMLSIHQMMRLNHCKSYTYQEEIRNIIIVLMNENLNNFIMFYNRRIYKKISLNNILFFLY